MSDRLMYTSVRIVLVFGIFPFFVKTRINISKIIIWKAQGVPQ